MNKVHVETFLQREKKQATQTLKTPPDNKKPHQNPTVQDCPDLFLSQLATSTCNPIAL